MSEDTAPIDDRDALRESLLEWYDANARDFPWRDTTDPYAILVAEVMSQQTQLDRIRDPWRAFVDRWPTVHDLAGADRSDVIGFWTNHRLGYNTRARYLHETATRIVEEHSGVFPSAPDELQTLPGVGPYTANAVASFAFNTGRAVVDTNVKRVLYRVFPEIGSADDPSYDAAANALMPSGQSRAWNNAIMELGAVACQPTPQCEKAQCPWRRWCHAYTTGDFTAPDTPSQSTYEGSRRQFRGRIIRALQNHRELSLHDLGPLILADYDPSSENDREWLAGLVRDLEDDGLIQMEENHTEPIVRLYR